MHLTIPPVLLTIGLWALRVALVLTLPTLSAKALAITLMLVMPYARRFVVRWVGQRLETGRTTS